MPLGLQSHKRIGVWAGLAALTAVGLVLCTLALRAGEPSHDGHSLSYWVRRTDFVPFIDLNMHGEGGFAQRDQAFRALAAIGAPAVPALCQILENKALKWDRRWRAAETLGQIGRPAKSAYPALIRALNDPTFPANNRYSVVMSVVAVGAAGDCASELTRFLKGRYAAIPLSTSSASDLDQRESIEALAKAGEPGKVAVPLLVEMLRGYQKAASSGAPSVSPGSPEAERWAFEAREFIRVALIEALGNLGTFDVTARPALLDSCNDPSPEVRLRVAEALLKLDESTAPWPLLDELAGNPKPYLRRQVVEVLGEAGRTQTTARVPRLMRMLEDADDEVRWLAAEKLGTLGTAARPALGKLKELTKDKSERVREEATEAIGKLDPPSDKK